MIASRTANPIVTALKVAMCDSWLRVRGKEIKNMMMADTALKVIVHSALFESVLSSSALTMQCKANQRSSQCKREKNDAIDYTLDERIVQDKHEGSRVIGKLRAAT